MNRAHGAKATANSAHRLRFGTHRSDDPEMPHCLSVGGRTVHRAPEERHGVFIVVLLVAAGEASGEACGGVHGGALGYQQFQSLSEASY